MTFVDQNMISTNSLSVFLLHHHLNGLGNKNLRSIQDVMRASEPAAEKFKRVCEGFPNLAILTKSSTPGEIQSTFGNKNICSIQDVMHAREPAAEKFNRVCEDFPNLAILTKSSTPGKIQLTFGHASVRS